LEPVKISLAIIVVLVLVALAFDFMNGFHDAANAIATIVSTRVLKPHQAVLLAATFNFIAVFVFHLKVATTVGRGIIDPTVVDHYVVFGALIGAIGWNVITWYFGIPSSSSHALIGGLVGAAVAKSGVGSLIASGLLKTVAFIVIAPLMGFALGATFLIIVSWLFVRSTPARINLWFRRVQLVTCSMYSLGHGGNDAQKTIGIIWMLLIAAGMANAADDVPTWVVVCCYVTIALGTAFGGWRIVKTMGQHITKLRPYNAVCAELSGSFTLFLATMLGIPVSTTHTITGAIIGVGSVNTVSAVRWGVAGNIVLAWVLTIPCSAFMAAVAWWVARHVI
jgi:inorganic phosphate transporter, PiT family